MKVCFLILLVFGAYGTVTCTLRDDFIDILAIIPVDQIEAIFTYAVQNDKEIQDFAVYFQSDEFTKLYDSAEFKEIVENERFVKVVRLVNAIPEFQPITHYIYSTFFKSQQLPPPASGGKTLRDVFDIVRALVDFKSLAELLLDKLNSSPEFLELYQSIQATEDLFDALINLPPIQKGLQMYRDYGADVDSIINSIRLILGW